MDKLNPWAAGTALAITSGIVFTACAAALTLWPEATLEFFNAWFHGMDLRLLVPPGGRPLAFGQFFYGLTGVIAFSFGSGALFAFAYNLVRRCPGCSQGH